MINGQEKITSFINKCTLDTLPRTLMFIGQKGSGKHLIATYISEKFNLTLLDITDKLDYDTIEEINNRTEPYLYLIQINKVSVKEQNTILKFLEEPLKNSFIVLIAEHTLSILPTILNRCNCWTLQEYTKDFLSQFSDNIDLIKIANTPGQIIELTHAPFNDMVELANKIITKIELASVPNTLTLSNKIAFKNEKDKFNLDLFMLVLSYRITDMWRMNVDIRYPKAYMVTSDLVNKLRIPNVEQRPLFEKYLIDLRKVMKGLT